jgi:hypothetical protein
MSAKDRKPKRCRLKVMSALTRTADIFRRERQEAKGASPLSLPILKAAGMAVNPFADLPDEQFLDPCVQPPLQKFFASPLARNTFRTPAIPSRGGALAIVTNVEAGCGGRGSVGRVT